MVQASGILDEDGDHRYCVDLQLLILFDAIRRLSIGHKKNWPRLLSDWRTPERPANERQNHTAFIGVSS